MAEVTTISWCDHTLNFWIGCTKVGPGCDHCYAEARDKRFEGGAHWGVGAPRRERLLKACEEARRLNARAMAAGRRRRVFVNSLSDFFDNEVPDAWRAYALGVMRACDWLDFEILTKRIGNALQMVKGWYFWPLPNVWVGITVVDQGEADRDIPKLKELDAAKRYLSIEPQLGRVDLCEAFGIWWNSTEKRWEQESSTILIDWVICGGESGHGARPMQVEWARSLRDVCAAAGVPFHFKQWGEWAPYDRGAADSTKLATPGALDAPMQRFGSKLAGHLLDGREHLEFPK